MLIYIFIIYRGKFMVEITGSDLIDILATAGYHLKSNAKKIDDLNVFPVPDGDTGSNMSYTYISGLFHPFKIFYYNF